MNLETNKKEFISFQKLKIYTIQEIDNYINLKISKTEENIINNLLKIIYSIYVEDILFLSDDLMAIKKSILSILGENFKLNTENIDFILLMGDYIAKLRCYSINKKTYVENSDPRYIINLNENDEIIDPIFGKVYVKSKCLRDNILYVNLKSKSGVYSMRFKKMINYIALRKSINSSSVVSAKKQISFIILFLRSIKSLRPVFSLVYSNAFIINNKSFFDNELIDILSNKSILNSLSILNNIYKYKVYSIFNKK